MLSPAPRVLETEAAMTYSEVPKLCRTLRATENSFQGSMFSKCVI